MFQNGGGTRQFHRITRFLHASSKLITDYHTDLELTFETI